jgi:hypothetical protein
MRHVKQGGIQQPNRLFLSALALCEPGSREPSPLKRAVLALRASIPWRNEAGVASGRDGFSFGFPVARVDGASFWGRRDERQRASSTSFLPFKCNAPYFLLVAMHW